LWYNPNIIFSGHTLGGSIKLPFAKPLFLPNNSTNYYLDHYKLKETELYISNGLGTSGINARLNNHPSINLYRFYKVK
jgi:predicted MPP superfamily phosphohydrolase